MIRRHALAFRTTLMLADGGLAIGLAFLLSVMRFGRDEALPKLNSTLPDTRAMVLVFAVAWVVALWMHGLYRSRTRWTFRSEARDILRATATFAVATLAFLFVFKLPDVSRLLLLYLFPSMAAMAFLTRVGLRLLLARLRESGRNTRFMLVVGANERAQQFADLVECHQELGIKVIGHLKGTPTDNGVVLTRPSLGTLDELITILHSEVVDEVAICLPFSEQEAIDEIARLCEEEGKIVRIPVAVLERTLSSGRIENIDGTPIISLVSGSDRIVGLAAKRALDLGGSAFLLLLLSPLFALLAALVKLESSGDALFRQERVGLHGRTFRVVKFRSMCSGAEQQLEGVRQLNVIRGHAFKAERDPRVTRVGRFLRRTSLDELPQLWNVLRGEMSLVGPRPPLPREVAEYDVWHRRRLSMKPGMTGLWQIGARSEAEFDRWVEKDLEYIDRWSFWLDLKIIARTVPAMLSGEGR
jgi:exopolysaccharide biosynthesis polyprenyl glycosylphosphotransferase